MVCGKLMKKGMGLETLVFFILMIASLAIAIIFYIRPELYILLQIFFCTVLTTIGSYLRGILVYFLWWILFPMITGLAFAILITNKLCYAGGPITKVACAAIFVGFEVLAISMIMGTIGVIPLIGCTPASIQMGELDGEEIETEIFMEQVSKRTIDCWRMYTAGRYYPLEGKVPPNPRTCFVINFNVDGPFSPKELFDYLDSHDSRTGELCSDYELREVEIVKTLGCDKDTDKIIYHGETHILTENERERCAAIGWINIEVTESRFVGETDCVEIDDNSFFIVEGANTKNLRLVNQEGDTIWKHSFDRHHRVWDIITDSNGEFVYAAVEDNLYKITRSGGDIMWDIPYRFTRLQISSNDDYLYAAAHYYSGGKIYLIDTTSGSVISESPQGLMGTEMELDSEGNVYTFDYFSGSVKKINPSDWNIEWEKSLGPTVGDIAIYEDKYVYAAGLNPNLLGIVWKLNASNGETLVTYSNQDEKRQQSIFVGMDGFVYASGSYRIVKRQNLIKFDLDLNPIWEDGRSFDIVGMDEDGMLYLINQPGEEEKLRIADPSGDDGLNTKYSFTLGRHDIKYVAVPQSFQTFEYCTPVECYTYFEDMGHRRVHIMRTTDYIRYGDLYKGIRTQARWTQNIKQGRIFIKYYDNVGTLFFRQFLSDYDCYTDKSITDNDAIFWCFDDSVTEWV